jgi:hypothetical protein
MTDIDPRADIEIAYREDDLMIVIPLAGEVTDMWCRRYGSLARAKGVRAQAYTPRFIHLTVPVQTESEDVLKMLDATRSLIAEADAVVLSPTDSNSPETIARRWWARQQA